MRLNETIKTAFIRAVMDDVPQKDYAEEVRILVQKAALKALPPAIKKLYEDDATRDYVNTKDIYTALGYVRVYAKKDFTLSETIKTKLDDIKENNRLQSEKRSGLKKRLESVVAGCRTKKQLVDTLPEFEKYLPPADEKTANLPAVANVVSDFVSAGWPICKTKSKR